MGRHKEESMTAHAILPDFEGKQVHKAKLKITKTGDGLSHALSLGPKAWRAGDEIYIVLKAEVAKISHDTEKDSDDLVRVHTAEAVEATEVAAQDIDGFLAAARERLALAKDKAAGQTNLLEKAAGPGVKAGVRVVDEDGE